MRRTLRLHGELVRVVGAEEVPLEVSSVAEAVRALVVQVPEARRVLQAGAWRVVEDGLDLDHVDVLISRQRGGAIDLIPVLEGAGDFARGGPLKIIAGIFLLGATLIGGAAGIALFAGTSGTVIGGIGASLALTGIARVLAPAPDMDYMIPEEADRRQSRLFSGSSNLQGSGHPIPLVYGTMRTGSVQVSETVETVDLLTFPDLTSKQRLYVVDVISEGEIEGLLTGDAVSVLFDGTRIQEAQGTVNFADVSIDVVNGAAADPSTISWVESIEIVNTEATNADGTPSGGLAGAVARTISDPNVDSIRVTLQVAALYSSGGAGLSTARLRWDINSNGGSFEQVAISHEITSSGNLLDQAIRTTSVTDCTGFYADLLVGYTSDPGADEYIDFEYRVNGTTPWNTVRITNTSFTTGGSPNWQTTFEIRVKDLHPIAQYQYRVVFENVSIVDTGFSTGFVATYGPDIYWPSPVRVVGTPYEIDFRISDLVNRYGPAPWTVRLVKETQDQTAPAGTLHIFNFARYAPTIEREFIYPNVARASLSFDADSTGGRIPAREYEIEGIKLELPSNLTPATRTYSGIWDGTFASSRAFYDNPAWVLWDVLRSSRYGLGLAESEIDKWSVYDAAVWCDELVDDGAGGTHPRFIFDHPFSTFDDALSLAQSIATSMQCRLWWGNGKVFVTQDRPIAAARIFTNANVKGGEFRYQGVALAARTTVAKVSYRNAANGYESEPDLVDRPYAIDRYGRHESDVLGIGITRWAQARRRGRWEVLSSELEDQTAEWTVGVENALVEPGQIAEVWDRNREEVRYGGRIAALNYNYGGGTADLLLDSPVDPNETIRLLLDDQSIHESDLTDPQFGSGDTAIVDLVTAIPGGRSIKIGAPWIVTSASARYFRCIGIQQGTDGEFTIQGVRHDPTKQSQVEDFADIGSPIAFYSGSGAGEPSIMSTALVFDAPSDLWSVDIQYQYTSGLLGTEWTALEVEITAIAFYGIRVSGEIPVPPSSYTYRIPIGDHDVVGGQTLDVKVRGVTGDGAVYSSADTDSLAIPASRP